MNVGTHDSRIRSAEYPQPTFLTAIAQELAYVHGGTVQQHAGGARRMLEEAFRSLGQKGRVVRHARAVHAA
jgi:hypothetical protein